MRIRPTRLPSLIATTLVILLSLPSAGLADNVPPTEHWHSVTATFRSETRLDIRLKDGQRIKGIVHAVTDDGLVVKYPSGSGMTQRLLSFEEMQTVVKPGVRRWWQKTERVIAAIVLVSVVVVLGWYAAAGGDQ